MSELRYDPVKRKWSVIATERSRRPIDFSGRKNEPVKEPVNCPFCAGNEDKVENEIFSIKTGNKWDLRVVPNKYPALRIEGELKRSGRGIYDNVSGIGAHEVIIETPAHSVDLSGYSQKTLYNLFYAFRQRFKDLYKDTRFRYVLGFKNYGEQAGASLWHPHSQIIATPVIPDTIKTKLQAARDHYRRKERCIFCDILEQERAEGIRIVYENQDFIAFCPYAASFPFELHVYPKVHGHSFNDITDSQLHSLGDMMKEVFGRLYDVLENPPLNFYIHTSPPLVKRPGLVDYWESIEYDFHWHIEIIPRITGTAGFEWGSGLHINPVEPEESAKFLKGTV